MSLKAFLKRCLMRYFIVTTFVTAAIGILGLILDPTAKIGYDGFFSPLIFGLVSFVPSVVIYSRKELTARQMLVRELVQFVLLEAMLVSFAHWAGILHAFFDTACFVLSVLIVSLAVHLVGWHLDSRDAREINSSLKALQRKQ